MTFTVVSYQDRGGMLHGEFIEQSTTATLAVNVISVKPQQMTVKENKPLGTLVGIVDRVYSPGTESMMYFIIGISLYFIYNSLLAVFLEHDKILLYTMMQVKMILSLSMKSQELY